MADDGNYLAQMLSAGQSPGTDVQGNLNKGMDFGQKIQNIPMQNMYRQQKMQEMEKQKQVDAAIKQYGQTGDINPLAALDPVLAGNTAKAMDDIKARPPEKIRDMESVFGQLGRIWPMVNEGNWKEVKTRLLSAHPNMSPDDLPPDNASAADIKRFATAIQVTNATLEGLKKGGKVLKGGDILADPGGNVLAQAPLNKLQKAQALKAETGAQKDFADVQDPGRKWKPEPFVNSQGEVRWVKPGQETN